MSESVSLDLEGSVGLGYYPRVYGAQLRQFATVILLQPIFEKSSIHFITTFRDGCLGLDIDEGRSKMR